MTRKGPATIQDVAAAAGVSAAIVSRVLSGDTKLRVREETRRRVLDAATTLDYVPNHTAQALRLASSGAIGLILHDVTNPLYAEILKGAHRAADQAGYVVLLVEADELGRKEATFRRILGSGRIDGALFQAGGFEDDAAIRRIAQRRLPTVLINSYSAAGTGSVVLDDVAAGAVAARHLLALGHRDIGFVGGLTHSHQGRRRRRGVSLAMAEAGVRLRRRWTVEGGWNHEGGQRAFRTLLSREGRPTAIVVANVMAAIGVLYEARALGVRIPEEASVIGIHDTWFAMHATPPLTTVRVPLAEMGRRSVLLLLEMLAGGAPRSIVVRDPLPAVAERGSTAARG
jgi:DNA-binding LacI/PurR family transcriptional regulator